MLPVNVKTPAPALVNVAAVAPLSEITPEMVDDDVSVLVILISPPTLIATASKSSVETVKPVSPVELPIDPVTETSPVPLVVIVNIFAPLILPPKVTLPFDVVVKVTFWFKVTLSVNSWLPEVVISAWISEVVDTAKELASSIAESKLKLPIISISPRPFDPPTACSKAVSVNIVDKLLVSDAPSVAELSTAPVKVNCTPPLKVMFSEIIVVA